MHYMHREDKLPSFLSNLKLVTDNPCTKTHLHVTVQNACLKQAFTRNSLSSSVLAEIVLVSPIPALVSARRVNW